ncbi:ATPase, T2SS/T4P/T4SS family [Wenzhouxiangella marina]|uniref:Protein-L-isoaspartate(D-aspartate) O-methyltransferase n=1 Tax=Wenzhouxiangella marina TaxID=1579979 RepID=A0A0K0XWS1_9GAMM|nr:ATPase, T2SS/T4P/T4SS family [Wenzhouxiangella marina]AKS42066.1 Protein-L-isoaspartate(D-aspartate) O-methyltransferase [Wenzhouxiangella marina]MBB6086165.1 type IV pilus assembly protein PilB [Wenzhouxiangella marina]
MNARLSEHQVAHIVDRIDRSRFVASPDLRHVISGRTIPPRNAMRHLLTLMGEVPSGARVLVVGGGSGYLPALMACTSDRVCVLEKEPAIAEIARANLARIGLERVEVRVGRGEDGWPERSARFDLILSVCSLDRLDVLLDQLSEDGFLYTLEGPEREHPVLIQRQAGAEDGAPRALGTVIFSRSSSQILIDLGFVEPAMLDRAREEAHRRHEPVLAVIRNRLGLEDADFYRTLARQRDMKFVGADEVLQRLDSELFHRYSRTFLDNRRVLPVSLGDEGLVVVTDNPDLSQDEAMGMEACGRVRCLLVTPTDFRRIWSALELTERSEQMLSWSESPSEQASNQDLLELSKNEISHYLVSIYEAILLDAVSANASDVHVERYGNRIRIRIRSDGELHDLTHYRLTPRDHAGLINVIKVRAEINIAERRLPQGGRSHMRVGNTNYDLRVQIQPSLHGEHAVIRLLSQTGRVLGLDELGMATTVAGHYERLLDNPAGLVLVVGPTGSGKSTTLYAGLQQLADDGRRKVITVEDPIEYSIDNIQQTRARPDIGFGFADAMRSFVRQDPDVILVGEIRDRETALEAIRASQTGHLVLSTLHSNDSVDAMQRMYDLEVLPNSLASELRAVIAQRLAKRICPNCRQQVEPDPRILRELFPEQVPSEFKCYEGRGCVDCGGRGTHGRIAVVEFLQVNDELRDLISRRPAIGELRWRALDNGLITMRDSALDHVIEGIIPMSELPRLLPQDRMAPEQRGGRRTAT